MAKFTVRLMTSGILATAAATLVAGTSQAADRCDGKKPYLIYYATHAVAEPVWATVKKGAEQGADDNCLKIKWTQDDKFSMGLSGILCGGPVH
ncbi:hypothetical protein [Rhizobium leguminosarum]|uniref:hypothetical protein n=1 Tax=Rhizobium leguminosarum TaxID=384 RepID=UPI000484E295|nr:hypothetical protein [Rhizobium leguminosarum]WFT90988.1 hypothetical protein QA638_36880 [Rhizobium leguminosarum]